MAPIFCFHIDLRAPELKPLPQNLLANTAGDPSITATGDALIASAQAWFDQVKADLNLTQGEVTMFIPDMPNVPPQNAPVMIAQANQAQAGDTTKIRTFGVCSPSPNNNYSLDNVIDPILSAGYYLQAFEHRNPTSPATTTIVQQPKHGMLRLVTEADRGTLFDSSAGPLRPDLGLYAYLPEAGYVGKDIATIQVDFGNGLKVNVKYYFQALSQGLGDDWVGDYCSKTGPYWKISTTLNPDGTNTLTSVEYQSPTIDAGATTTATLASTLSASLLSTFSVDPSSVTFNFADLPGGAVGQTTETGNATIITLDPTAAGYNWFIDTTGGTTSQLTNPANNVGQVIGYPADNSEYLPTSNPDEWVAKVGTAAYGKMDMLSVLLHEYGHALGIEHSTDPHDFMGTTLTVGVRRLPSAAELALMQQLVAQAKGGTAPTTPDNTPFPGLV